MQKRRQLVFSHQLSCIWTQRARLTPPPFQTQTRPTPCCGRGGGATSLCQRLNHHANPQLHQTFELTFSNRAYNSKSALRQARVGASELPCPAGTKESSWVSSSTSRRTTEKTHSWRGRSGPGSPQCEGKAPSPLLGHCRTWAQCSCFGSLGRGSWRWRQWGGGHLTY